jgi:hypothetical protein
MAKPRITAHGKLTGKEQEFEPDPAVTEFLERYRRFVTEYYGPRCKTRAAGCRCCEAWALYDFTSTFTA